MNKVKPMRIYLGRAAFAAILSGLLTLFMAAACLASAYHEALEQQFVCDADNCVLDSRTWFERYPGMWGLGLGSAAICIGVVAHLAVQNRKPHR